MYTDPPLHPNMSVSTALLAIHIGPIAEIGSDHLPSAIAKHPIAGRIKITPLGLVGDFQADRLHHGGPDKALHHYPAEHYAAWRSEQPNRSALFQPGGFGENLSTLGICENAICLGDRFRLGSALVQVSQGRQPCSKLNQRFAIPDMLERVLGNGRTGWYYRVLEPGETGVGDSLTLLERPLPDWPLTRLWQVLFGPEKDPAALAWLSQQPLLAASWRERAARRIKA